MVYLSTLLPVKIAVLGAGAWGSVLAQLARRNGHLVTLWSRHQHTPLEPAVCQADVIISAVSMSGVTALTTQLLDLQLPQQTIFVTATKGLDGSTTFTPSQIWQQAFPTHPIVVLSGPNLSKEIELGLPAATVVSSLNREAAEQVQRIFASDCFRVYTNSDPLGTELGGALKNVIAIAVGVCDGLQLGANAKAGLITRALPEIIQVGICLGAKVETFYGLSGLGDMLATCNSALSRNYRVGYGLAQGKSLAEVLQEVKGTAEGINTANVLATLAQQQQIVVPVCHQVYLLLNGKITPQQAVEALMERDLKPEALRT